MTEELKEFLKDLDAQEFQESTIEAFEAAGTAMIIAGVPNTVELLTRIQSAMSSEYGC